MGVKKHFVTFYSPGTFFAEDDVKPIHDWDIETAVEMARDITQRYNATPYGFRFITRARNDEELDSKIVETSPMYYLGGKVETIEEVEARADPDERTLLANMRGNGYGKIIINTNSWKWTQPLKDDDVILDFVP